MATTRTVTTYPTIGAVWVAFVAKWQDFVTNGGYTITFGTEPATGLPDARAWYIQGVLGADTFRFVYISMDIQLSSTKTPMLYLANSPGWRYMPPILLTTFGATNTLTSFQTVLAGLRALMWSECCGVTAPTYTTTTNTLYATNYFVHTLVGVVQKLFASVADVLAITRVTTTWNTAYLSNQQNTDGVGASPTYPSTTMQSMDGVVLALQDIAHQTTVASFNNGAYTVLLQGGDQVSSG